MVAIVACPFCASWDLVFLFLYSKLPVLQPKKREPGSGPWSTCLFAANVVALPELGGGPARAATSTSHPLPPSKKSHNFFPPTLPSSTTKATPSLNQREDEFSPLPLQTANIETCYRHLFRLSNPKSSLIWPISRRALLFEPANSALPPKHKAAPPPSVPSLPTRNSFHLTTKKKANNWPFRARLPRRTNVLQGDKSTS